MSSAKVRTHVLLPKELLDEIDELVGARRRSEVIAEAVDAWMIRNRQLRAIRAVKNSPPPAGDPPEWDTPEGVAKWVHDLRREESSRTRRIEELQREDQS